MAVPVNVGAATVGGGNGLTLASGSISGSSAGTTRKGDMVTVFVGYSTTSGAKPATPSGWTEIAYRAQGVQKLSVFAKYATSDAAVSFSFGGGDIAYTVGATQSIHTWRNAAGGHIEIMAAGDGADAVANLAMAANVPLGINLAIDDIVLVAIVATNGMTTSFTGYSVTASGITFDGTQRARARGADTPLAPILEGSLRGSFLATQHNVTAGGGPATLAVAASWSTTNSVQTLAAFVIRETAPLVFPKGPTVTLVSPAEGATTSTTDIVVDVTDDDGDLARVEPRFTFPVIGVPELAHDWDTPAFIGPYVAASSRSSITNGYRYTFDRGGWVDTNMSLQVVATDAGGRTTVKTFAWTTDFGGSYSCTIEGDPPVITKQSPAGTAVENDDTITLRATDPDADIFEVYGFVTFDGLGLNEPIGHWLTVLPPGAPVELQKYYPPYETTSSRNAVTGGWDFGLNRDGGWIDTNFTVWLVAVDYEGHATLESFSFTCADPASVTPPVEPGEPLPTAEDEDLGGDAVRARDIYIDPVTNNIALTADGDLALVGGVPSITQDIRQAFRMFLAEWFLDEEEGIPWLPNEELGIREDQAILGRKNPSLPAIRELFRDKLLSIDGVLEIKTLEVALDNRTRTLSVDFHVNTDLGELVETIEVP